MADFKAFLCRQRQDNVTNITVVAADIQQLRQALPTAMNSQRTFIIKLPESRY